MNQEYFEGMSDFAKKMQEPFQAMAELNIKTLQSFSYLKPEDLTQTKRPEELLEKQIELMIANSHKALDYMQKSFQIFEKTLTSFLPEAKIKANGKKS